MIQTNRLELAALSADRLGMLINDVKALETDLNCRYEAEPIEGFFKQILQSQLEIVKKTRKILCGKAFGL